MLSPVLASVRYVGRFGKPCCAHRSFRPLNTQTLSDPQNTQSVYGPVIATEVYRRVLDVKKILSRQETPNSVLKDMQGKVKGGKQKRRHESSGVFRPGYGTELCSRSFLFPKRHISVSGSARCRGSSWSAGWRRQQKVKRWLACRDAADMGQVVFAAWASAKRARTAFQVGA